MLGAALVSWATVTHSYENGTLTVNYEADGVELKLDDICNQYGCAGQVTKLVLSGDFTNDEWQNKTCSFIEQCAGNNKLALDIKGCTKLVSQYIGFTETGGETGTQTDMIVTKFNTVTKDQLKEEVKYLYWGTNEADPDKVYQKDGKYYFINQYGNETEVTPTKTYVYEFDNGTTGNVTDNNDGTYTLVNTFTLGNAKGKIKSISFPESDNFTFVKAELVDNNAIESVTLSQTIKALDIKAFFQCKKLASINFTPNLEQIGGDCFNTCEKLDSADLVNTKLDRVRYHTFNDCSSLKYATFPTTLKVIQTQAYQRTQVENVDLSQCHDLRLIGQKAFEFDTNLKTVTVCSHPKVIKGDEGAGAFNNCKHIKTVEVVGCDNTNLVECICENNAFDPDITYVQTAIENIETMGARLIFPQNIKYDMPMQKQAGNLNTEYLGYASSFDYFVGDYKEGVPFRDNQSCLEAYFKFAPRGQQATATNFPNTGDNTQVFVETDNKMAQVRGIGNGWHEFMNVSVAIILPKNEEFLRTYSRTAGSGPVLLTEDFSITAYRAVDYISAKDSIVKDNYNGNLFFIGDPNNPQDVANPEMYQDSTYCEAHDIAITGKPNYKLATIKGNLYLRALRPYDKTANKFDESLSYIPEETGVVLYSKGKDEYFMLILPDYTGDQYDLSSNKYKYPHTGLYRFEKERQKKGGVIGDLDNANDDLKDNINLLEGSYGVDTPVAPVWPWNFNDKVNYKGGTYNPNHMDYREFGFNKSKNKWVRLQPGVLRYNRAYAKIPVSRFDNNNETSGQMPDFTLDDMPVGSEGSANTFLAFGTTFEDEVTDGIQTVNFTKVATGDDAWYTLQGVKVAQPTKGVYIHNNKKVVIK